MKLKEYVIRIVEFIKTVFFLLLRILDLELQKSFSVRVSNSTMGLPSLEGTPLTAIAKKVLKAQAKRKLQQLLAQNL